MLKLFSKKYKKLIYKTRQNNPVFPVLLKIFPCLFVFSIIFSLILALWHSIINTPLFIIKNVEVVGLYCPFTQDRERGGIKGKIASYFLGKHQMHLSLKQYSAIIKLENPQLDYVNIKRILPDKIIVEAYIKSPVAAISVANRIYIVTDTGFVLKEIQRGKIGFLPKIIGIERNISDIPEGKALNSKRLKRALFLLRNIAGSDFLGKHRVTRVDISDFGNPVVWINEMLPLYIGLNNIEEEMAVILRHIFSDQEDLGSIRYIDLRSRNVFIERK